VLVAIFGPELMLYNAIDQLLCARNLRKEFSKALEEISLGKKEAVNDQSRRIGSQDSIEMESQSDGGQGEDAVTEG